MDCLVISLLLLSLGSSWAIIFRDEAPVVRTSLGRIQGSTMTTFRDKTIYAFRGIPYAQPPVEELRFMPPEPVQPWGDDVVLKATSDSLVCPQTGLTIFMSEDCLKINVFTKSFDTLLPVIVYIHGGANVLGSGHSIYEAGPQYLLDQDVVFVAFNYRLGALGFLSTGVATDFKGNYGFLDQQMALGWVQSHISTFGGDSQKVTILGMSAGSMAVSLHLASPLSEGLFHRAILMSGSATNHFDIDNIFWTRKLAREVGCPMYDPTDVVGCLRNISWKRIVEVCSTWEPYQFINMKWNYEIDGRFLPTYPTDIIASGAFNRVPLLVSFAANELDYTVNKHLENNHLLHDINVNFNDYAPELFLYNYDARKSKVLKRFYLGKDVDEINEQNIQKFGQIFSDGIIGHGVHRLVDLARQHTNVYYSRMDYVGHRSLSAPKNDKNEFDGVGHADDLQYVMPGTWYGMLLDKNSSDVFMMERLTKWFACFAKYGRPTLRRKTWPACNATSCQLLYNGFETELGELAYTKRYAVWDKLFPKPTKPGKSVAAVAQSQLAVASLLAILVSLLVLS